MKPDVVGMSRLESRFCRRGVMNEEPRAMLGSTTTQEQPTPVKPWSRRDTQPTLTWKWSAIADILGSVDDREPGWLGEIYQLVAIKKPDEAIDVLFEQVDQLFSAGRFRRCDDLLRRVDLERLDTNLMVALLSITRSAAANLSFREQLVRNVREQLLKIAPERVDGLMSGLT